MFEQFREKLQLVQQDLSASFKTLTSKAREVGIGKRVTEHNVLIPDSSVGIKPCRYEAGAELLNKFQSSWAEVHNDIESSASRATAVDVHLNDVLRDYEKRTESLHQLHKHLHELPTMMTDIQTLTVTVGRLEAFFEELETMIINYEDLVEREEFKKNQINKQKELQKYKSQKDTEYARTKAHLQAENEQLVKEFEKAEEAKMKERQQAFEEVFTAEMDHYKQHGKVNEKVVHRDKKSTSSIDDFEFKVDDADKMALDDFLGADVTKKTKVSEKIQEMDEIAQDKESDTKLEDTKEHMDKVEITNEVKVEQNDEENVEKVTTQRDEEINVVQRDDELSDEKVNEKVEDGEEKEEERNEEIQRTEEEEVGDENTDENKPELKTEEESTAKQTASAE